MKYLILAKPFDFDTEMMPELRLKCAREIQTRIIETTVATVGCATGSSSRTATATTITRGSGSLPSSRTSRSRSRSTTTRLEQHLQSMLDRSSIQQGSQIPGATKQFSSTGRFTFNMLQKNGILNDGNLCAIISIILSIHRLRIKRYLIDKDQCQEFFTMSIHKTLAALPSQRPFSIQQLVHSFNFCSPPSSQINIGQFLDCAEHADNILRKLEIKRGSEEIFTKYLGSFFCAACNQSFEDIEDWPSRLSYIIPSFPVGGIDGTSVDIWTLLEEYVNRPIESTCSVCRGTITGKLRVKPGKFSIFGINRLEYENQKVIQNNVLITNNPVQGQPLILW